MASLLCLLITAGCAPSEIKPPAATLEAEGIAQTAGIGSYCWKNIVAGQCVDVFAIATPEQPLSFPRDGSVRLRLPLENPTAVGMTITPVNEADALAGSPQGTRWWKLPAAASDALLLQAEQPIELELEPGLHVLSIDAQWEDVGGVLYSFLLEAR